MKSNGTNPPKSTAFKIKAFKKDLFEFIVQNGIGVESLLTAKGFSVSPSDYTEKIGLLHCEVSELIDAYKKGLGDDAEGEELADIAIRLMNIPCMFHEIYDFNDSYEEGMEEIIIFFEYLTEESSAKEIKYTIINAMHRIISSLDDDICRYYYYYRDSDDYFCSFLSNNEKKEAKESMIIAIVYHMYAILTLIYFYASFLNMGLQNLVNLKMEKNWERPYRFNTSPEHFK